MVDAKERRFGELDADCDDRSAIFRSPSAQNSRARAVIGSAAVFKKEGSGIFVVEKVGKCLGEERVRSPFGNNRSSEQRLPQFLTRQI